MKNRETYVVFILDCWAIPGYSILKTVPAIRDSNMLKLREFVHYKTKPVLELLGVCEQTSYVSGRFRFFWISWKLTDHCHKTQRASLSFRNSRIYLGDSDHFFRDPWVPLTFFPAAMLDVYLIPIKIHEKKKQCFDSTLGKRAYKAFEWEAKFVWVMRGFLSDVDYF